MLVTSIISFSHIVFKDLLSKVIKSQHCRGMKKKNIWVDLPKECLCGKKYYLNLEKRFFNSLQIAHFLSQLSFLESIFFIDLFQGLSVERLSSSPINLQVSQSPADGVNDTFLNTDCDRDSVGSGETASVTLPTMSACSSPAFR